MLSAAIALVRLLTVDVVSRSYRDYVELLSLPNLICLFSEALSLIIRYVYLTELRQPLLFAAHYYELALFHLIGTHALDVWSTPANGSLVQYRMFIFYGNASST